MIMHGRCWYRRIGLDPSRLLLVGLGGCYDLESGISAFCFRMKAGVHLVKILELDMSYHAICLSTSNEDYHEAGEPNGIYMQRNASLEDRSQTPPIC